MAAPAKPPIAPSPKPTLATPPPNPSISAPAKPPPEPTASILKHEVKPAAVPPKVFKPESRLQPGRAQTPPPTPPPADAKGKGGSIEWLPWGELSGGQRAGRAAAGVVVLILIFFFLRGMLRGVASSNQSTSDQQGAVAMSDSDRRDGIESLCKIFQIYGIPKNQQDAIGAAKNAAEMFKLAGNQTPERSTFILTAIAEEFRAGKLQGNDCAQAGAPISTAGADNAAAPGSPESAPTR
ncbi:MAG TPA: hypothetical protein VNU00_05485 [Candidatus Binataceae bacterium]|nr:hypothetical protein [Candidatus Binataceae bacterium]